MTDFTRAEAAARAGLDAGYLDRLIELGVIAPKPDGSLHSGPVLFQEGD